MDIKKGIELNNNINNSIDLTKKQNNFLNTMLGKAINTGVDVGIRVLLPDYIEDHVINIKNKLLNFDVKDMISKTIKGISDLGKNALENITGNFNSINQIKNAIQNSDLLDTFSNAIDNSLDIAKEKGEINSDLTELIKQGKKVLLDNVENNIEKSFSNQVEIEEKLNKHINNWKNAYEKQNFKNMEKYFKNINKELSNLVPLEKSVKEARIIENIHTLIKTNGQNFNLNETEMELVNKLY